MSKVYAGTDKTKAKKKRSARIKKSKQVKQKMMDKQTKLKSRILDEAGIRALKGPTIVTELRSNVVIPPATNKHAIEG
jgi:hypothetical protein